MCIIAIKNTGIDFPPKSTLENCFDNNSDGAGFMWAEGGLVHYKKGFMDFESFWAALVAQFPQGSEEAKNKSVMMHFRIGTHGLKSAPSHTHPFPVVDSMIDMIKLEGTAKYCLMHNGILRYPGVGRWKYHDGTFNDKGEKNYIEPSDTMDLAHDIVLPLTFSKTFLDNPVMHRPISSVIGTDRVVILRGDGKFIYFGDFGEKDGILYSNTSYSYKKYKPPKEEPKTWNSRRGYWDDWDDEEWAKRYDNTDAVALMAQFPSTKFTISKSSHGIDVVERGLFFLAPGARVEFLRRKTTAFTYAPKVDGTIAVRVQRDLSNTRINGRPAYKAWAYQYERENVKLYWVEEIYIIANEGETVEDNLMPLDVALFDAASAFYDPLTDNSELPLLPPPVDEVTVPVIDPLVDVEVVDEVKIEINKEEKVAESA